MNFRAIKFLQLVTQMKRRWVSNTSLAHLFVFWSFFPLPDFWKFFLNRENGDATQYQLCALKMATTWSNNISPMQWCYSIVRNKRRPYTFIDSWILSGPMSLIKALHLLHFGMFPNLWLKLFFLDSSSSIIFN